MDPTGPERLRSRILAAVWIVDYPDGRQGLQIEIQIECEECGPTRYTIAGHHAQAVRQVLTSAIEKHPDLTQSEMTIWINDQDPMRN